MRAQDMIKFPASLWAKIGGRIATKIVTDSDAGFGISTSGKSVLGKKKKHKPYSAKYKILKAAGKAGPKNVSTDRQVSPPNLRLTNVMLGSIKAQKPTQTGVDVVFRDGMKVEYNARMGRDIYGISKDNEKRITNELSDFIGKQIGKYARDSINITIG
jgi:hypothetical protein